MSFPAADLTGKKFELWTVLSRAENGPLKEIRWNCRCECGVLRVVFGRNLTIGASKSCGCRPFVRRGNRTHGQSGTPAFRSWAGMMSRCYNPKATGFKYWGGRGITVCASWHAFENFLKDMGHPVGDARFIDRKETNGNYAPENCRWATRKEQNRNARSNVLTPELAASIRSLCAAGRKPRHIVAALKIPLYAVRHVLYDGAWS